MEHQLENQNTLEGELIQSVSEQEKMDQLIKEIKLSRITDENDDYNKQMYILQKQLAETIEEEMKQVNMTSFSRKSKGKKRQKEYSTMWIGIGLASILIATLGVVVICVNAIIGIFF